MNQLYMQHIESKEKHVQDEKEFKHGENHSQEQDKGKIKNTTKRQKKNLHCTHCEVDGHNQEHGWKLHPELKPNNFGGNGKQKTVARTQQDLGSNLGDEELIKVVGLQGKSSVNASSSSTHASHHYARIRSDLFHI